MDLLLRIVQGRANLLLISARRIGRQTCLLSHRFSAVSNE
jgi:hypothetical protein